MQDILYQILRSTCEISFPPDNICCGGDTPSRTTTTTTTSTLPPSGYNITVNSPISVNANSEVTVPVSSTNNGVLSPWTASITDTSIAIVMGTSDYNVRVKGLQKGQTLMTIRNAGASAVPVVDVLGSSEYTLDVNTRISLYEGEFRTEPIVSKLGTNPIAYTLTGMDTTIAVISSQSQDSFVVQGVKYGITDITVANAGKVVNTNVSIYTTTSTLPPSGNSIRVLADNVIECNALVSGNYTIKYINQNQPIANTNSIGEIVI